MNEYRNDRVWSDAYLPAVREIVGPRLLEPAPFDEDVKRSTDLMILKARDMRIAVRVRRPGYFQRYPYDFTIRAKRDSGAKTELEKILDGFGDWMFYGHASKGSASIEAWHLLDLAVFRAAVVRVKQLYPGDKDAARRELGVRDVPNGDGTTGLAFDIRFFPKDFILASSHHC